MKKLVLMIVTSIVLLTVTHINAATINIDNLSPNAELNSEMLIPKKFIIHLGILGTWGWEYEGKIVSQEGPQKIQLYLMEV